MLSYMQIRTKTIKYQRRITMKNEQIKAQEFIGKINGVEIKNEGDYNSMCFIMDNLSMNFEKTEVTGEFVKELSEAIRELWLGNDMLEMSEIEKEFYECIDTADNFSEIEFGIYGEDYYLEEINKKIKNNRYEFAKLYYRDMENGTEEFLKYGVFNELKEFVAENVENYVTEEQDLEKLKDEIKNAECFADLETVFAENEEGPLQRFVIEDAGYDED